MADALLAAAPTGVATSKPSLGTAAALMAASGAAALGYQMVWTEQAAAWLGHETAGVLAVVAAFFGGLSLGALALGGRIERSPWPGRWYAGCEAAAALWAVVLVALMDPVSQGLLRLIGPQPSPLWHWAVAFVGCTVLLLPATAALGATLPAMARVVAGLWPGRATIGALYAANTAGALFGVLAAVFWLVPTWGLTRSAAVCAGASGLCALIAWWRFGAQTGAGAGQGPKPLAGAGLPAVRHLSLQLAACGVLGIGYEVLVVRLLSQATESTVYTFALMLAVYLTGTALGAAAWQRLPRRSGTHRAPALLQALASSILVSGVALWGALTIRQALHAAMGDGMGPALAAEALLAAAAFGAPSFVMGALFAELAHAAEARGLGYARALGINTLGAALAPALVGVLGLPALGAKALWLMLVAGYLVLAIVDGRAHRGPRGAALVGAWLMLAWVAPPLQIVDLPPGGRLISHRDSALGVVTVVEDAWGAKRLQIDNHAQEGSSVTQRADGRQGLLPVLLHPAPRRALFVGLGTGVTAFTAAQDRELRLDVVELLPAVIDASPTFVGDLAAQAQPPRVQVHAGDARRWIRAGDVPYDLVVADNVHPARSGTGALYSVEHYRAVRQRLAAGGLFCQWLPLHQLDLPTLRSIVASFLEVYPQATVWLATHSLDTPVIGLVGWRDGRPPAAAAVRARLSTHALAVSPSAYGLGDEWAVLGSLLGDAPALVRLAQGAVANRDDRPVVAHAAPRITYASDSTPRDRLLELVQALGFDAASVWPGDAQAAARLQAYTQARNRFLLAGRDARPLADPLRMLDQVEQPLLEVLQISPDFRPAYEPLLRLARAAESRDPARAAGLLRELAQRAPALAEGTVSAAR